MRAENRGAVLGLLATGKCSSRIALAKTTGLTKMSISNIVGEFLEKGIVRQCSALQTSALGRNPVELEIGENAPKFVGILIHRAFCRAVLCDLRLNILREKSLALTKENARRLPELLFEAAEAVGGRAAAGIGVASIGPVDERAGVILNPPNFFGLTNVPVGPYLGKALGLPVLLDGQYSCAALAERHYGGAPADFIFVGLSNGIGSGVMTAGRLLKNAAGLSSELGHLSVDFAGRPCSCGSRGCLETYCSASVMAADYDRVRGGHTSFKALCKKPQAHTYLLEKCEILSAGLVSAVNLFNPQAIFLGDEGVFLPDACLQAVEKAVNARKLSAQKPYVRVLRPRFYENSQLVGAACLPINACFQGKILL